MAMDKTIIEHFLRVMDMTQSDILDAYDNPGRGITNSTYVFRTAKGDYLLRLPGRGTEMFCDRQAECALYERLRDEHITDEVCYFEPETGVRVTVYYPDSHVIDTSNETELRQAMGLLRRFHGLRLTGAGKNTALDRLEYYIQCVERVEGQEFYPDHFWQTRETVKAACGPLYADESRFQLVHGDCLPHNFLFPADRGPVLLDWEYAAVSIPMEDLGDFCHDGELDEAACVRLLGMYLDREPTREERRELFGFCAAVALMWGAWSVFKAKMEPDSRDFYIDYAKLGVSYARDSLERMRSYEEADV